LVVLAIHVTTKAEPRFVCKQNTWSKTPMLPRVRFLNHRQ
jgi:hypothetical protein